jgi:hypothetical protein
MLKKIKLYYLILYRTLALQIRGPVSKATYRLVTTAMALLNNVESPDNID